MIFGEDELGIVEFDKPITFVTLVLDQEDIDAIVESILNHPIEGCLTFAQLLRIVGSASFGKVSGAEGNILTFRGICDTEDRITATVDGLGNRTAVTLDGTDDLDVTPETPSVLTAQDVDNVVQGLFAKDVEACATFAQLNRLVAAALAGKSSGAELDAPVFRDVCDTVDRISATTDQDGNRLAVTVDGD